MKKNMGRADRIVRVLIASALVFLCAFDQVPPKVVPYLLVIAAVFVLTSLFATCPLYSLLRINTCGSSNKQSTVDSRRVRT